jgi:hypothetical protein
MDSSSKTEDFAIPKRCAHDIEPGFFALLLTILKSGHLGPPPEPNSSQTPLDLRSEHEVKIFIATYQHKLSIWAPGTTKQSPIKAFIGICDATNRCIQSMKM